MIDFLTLQTEEVQSDTKTEIKAEWRVERRGNRNPPGFAIFKRGKIVYVGYVGYHSRTQKPEGFPTYSQLAGKS